MAKLLNISSNCRHGWPQLVRGGVVVQQFSGVVRKT